MTTWYNGVPAAPATKPPGAINGTVIDGWAIGSESRTDSYGFGPAGDTFAASFGSGPFDATAVLTTPYVLNYSGLTLNPTGVDHFNLYWGKTVLLASSQSNNVPEPATLLLLGGGLLAAGVRRYRRRSV